MKTHAKPSGLTKWQTVERTIRRRIVNRVYEPGARLPTYDELESEFSLSRLMLQQVMRHLKQDGFVTSRVRQGLFVNPKPPHLNRIGVVTPRFDRVRFWEELNKSARLVAEERGLELVPYRNAEGDEAVVRQLRYDMENHLIGGLVSPMPIPESWDPATIPVPALVPNVPQTPLAIPYMLQDELLVRRALVRLQQRGVTRLAVIGNLSTNQIHHYLDRELPKFHLYCRPEWRFGISLESREAIENIVRLLLSLPPDQRPDGIFVTDDNYTSEVVTGVAATPLRVPDDLTIVSHYNWSTKPFDKLPVEYLGYDLVELLQLGFSAIQSCRETGLTPDPLLIPPRVRDDLSR